MPRGKNYVNQGKGVTLQASDKSKGSQMVVCQYGTGCTRADCIYRHPYGKDDGRRGQRQAQEGSRGSQSREPCMAYLAGICTFSAAGCRKRHPPPVECQRLIDKYSKVKCRFGDGCLTKGCLYLHRDDEGYDGTYTNTGGASSSMTNAQEPAYLSPQEIATAFPPLGATATTTDAADATSAFTSSGRASAASGGAPSAASNTAMSASAPSWAPPSAAAPVAVAPVAVGAGSWKPSAPGVPAATATAVQGLVEAGQQQQYYGQPGQETTRPDPATYNYSFSANAPDFRPPGHG